jgi:EmrB/QacA subfamily drug resistance transporter
MKARINWIVFLYTSIGVLLVFSNMTTMDVALPTIVRYFHASPLQGSWILLGYMLTNTIMLLAFGRLADIFGRKILYLIGLGIYTVASLFCALATSADALIVFRLMQAIGAASVVTNTTALLVDAYPPERMSLILGLNVSVAAGSSICGPLIGGALVSWLGWRALFWVAVPLGLFALIVGTRVLRAKRPDVKETFDYQGALLSFLSLGGLVLCLSEGGVVGWHSPLVAGCVAAFVLAGAAFVHRQLRLKHPLIDLTILTNPDLALAYYANFMMAVVQMATLILVSLFLQAVLSMDALKAGIHITGLAAGLMVGTAISARLIGVIAPRKVAAGGMSVITIATIGMSVLFGEASPNASIMTLVLFATGTGVGLFMTPNTTSIMTSVGAHRRGVANGMRAMVQNMGFVVGTAVSLAIVTAPLTQVAQHAVYSGQSHLLVQDQLLLFRAQYRIAFAVLTGLAFSAAIASMLRRTRRVVIQ